MGIFQEKLHPRIGDGGKTGQIRVPKGAFIGTTELQEPQVLPMVKRQGLFMVGTGEHPALETLVEQMLMEGLEGIATLFHRQDRVLDEKSGRWFFQD